MRRLVLIIATMVTTGFCLPKEITWVAIGDSITYLNEHTPEAGNRITKGCMTRVAEKLPYIHYINHGYNGWTSGGIAKDIEKLGLPAADVYSVFLGTNDWWAGRPVGKFADYENNTGNNTLYGSYRIIVDKLKQLNKGAKIILLTPMQRGDFVYIADMKNNAHGSYRKKNGQSLAQFAEAIITIAKHEGFAIADLYNNSRMMQRNLVRYKLLKDPKNNLYRKYSYPAYINIPFNPQTDSYPYPAGAIDMTYDGLHPSDEGYSIIAGMLIKIFEKFN